MRKPRRDVRLDDIITGQILGADSEVLALVLKIHLALEAILLEMMKMYRSDDGIYRLSFPHKTDELQRRGYILVIDKSALDRFNEFRNDFAHIFGHEVVLSDAMALARDLESSGIDFSDSVGRYTDDEATEYYGGLFGVLEEVGWCILSHAAFVLSERGGRDLFSTIEKPV
ncbi:hypothetical protein [Rhodopseudomonas parapalustris]